MKKFLNKHRRAVQFAFIGLVFVFAFVTSSCTGAWV